MASYGIILTPQAEADIERHKKNNPRHIKKIGQLVKSIKENPESGIGKPEPLKGDMAGFWSRRIDHKHRLIYRVLVEELLIEIVSCYGHYGDK